MLRQIAFGGLLALLCLATLNSLRAQPATTRTTVSTTTRTQLTYLLTASVQQELKLSEEQSQKLRAAQQTLTAAGRRGGPPSSTSDSATQAAQAVIKETLSPEQATRFEQIVLQQQEKTSVAGLFRNQAFVAGLALDAQQSAQVQAILDEDTKQTEVYRNAITSLFGAGNAASTEERTRARDEALTKYQDARKSSGARLKELLTADQQAKYKLALGEPFQGTLSQGFGDRGGFTPSEPDTRGGRGGRGGPQLGASTAPVTRFFREPQFHAELKLTPEQVSQAATLPSFGNVELARFQQIFTPEQIQRGRELSLQNAILVAGPTGPYRYSWVIEALGITTDQRQKLQAIHDETYSRYLSSARTTSPEQIAQRAELDRTVNERVAAVVGSEQQAKLKPLLGAAYQGPLLVDLPRGPEISYQLGTLEAPNVRFVRETPFHAELKLTPEQVDRAARIPTRGIAANNQPEDFLTPEQLRRARELTLQSARQTTGPAAPLRYKFVIQALAPSEEQRGKLLTILQETARGFGRTAQTDDNATEERLAAVLTAEQQARLKELLGPAYQGDLSTRTFNGTASSTGPTGFYQLGRSRAPQMSLLGDAKVQVELKLDDEQKRLALAIDTSTLQEKLSPEQLKRATELTYQYGRQTMGPAGSFLYAPLADELNLSAEQRTNLQTLLMETASQFFASGRGADPSEQAAARRKEQMDQADERLSKILQPEQQAKLRALLGTPYEARMTPVTRFSSRSGRGGGAGAPGGGDPGQAPAGGAATSGGGPQRGGGGGRGLQLQIGQYRTPTLRIMRDPKVHAELKLTAEQIQLATASPTAEFAASLSPDQQKRARELTLQYHAQVYGPAGPLLYREAVDAVKLSAEQSVKVQALFDETRTQFASPQGAAEQRASLERAVKERLAAILSSEQMEQLTATFGAPFQWNLANRDGGGTRGPGQGPAGGTAIPGGGGGGGLRLQIGQYSAPTSRILRDTKVHAELKLTAEQSELAGSRSAEFAASLSPDQLKRARELTLQYYALVYGPAGPLLYREAVEAVKLSAEQKAKVQALFDETSPQFASGLQGTPEQRASLERAVKERLTAILSGDQMEQLTAILGAPFQWNLPNREGGGTRASR